MCFNGPCLAIVVINRKLSIHVINQYQSWLDLSPLVDINTAYLLICSGFIY